MSKTLYVQSLPFLCCQRPIIVYTNDEDIGSNSGTAFCGIEGFIDLTNQPDYPYRKSQCLYFKFYDWLNADERCFHLRKLSAETEEEMQFDCGLHKHVRDQWYLRMGMRIVPLLGKYFSPTRSRNSDRVPVVPLSLSNLCGLIKS